MSTIRKTITLTDQQDAWIKAQITAGHYTNDSEYIRDLVRRDQGEAAKLRVLRKAIQEGRDSGLYEGDAFADIRNELGISPRNG